MSRIETLDARTVELLARFRTGAVPALARAISVVEGQRPGFQALLHEVMASGPQARRIGFTGPPGAGKSSLVAAAATTYRVRDEHVGVVAVDPTSPYSGGALLGDRIRMNDVATDPGIFIRSMATRGSLGGLATTTKEVVDLMDGFGFARILIETVGVGQTELEITAAADTVVVVLVPESGDAIQAMKAGLMEIADVFVVNKADRPGSARLVKELRQALHLRAGSALKDIPAHHGVDLGRALKRERTTDSAAQEVEDWPVPVLTTNALTNEGVDDLVDAVERHRSWLVESGQLEERRRDRAEGRVRDVVNRELQRITWSSDEVRRLLGEGVLGIAGGEETPYSVARRITDALLR
ncbi:MAG: methylmalonyl Co-A mutase-associated GTPase MeaB [Gemmatimonadota bacterium]|nr:methylmalonyl Co-A mutase-associated GTPase MeaB [Gemmatimonadota bacterium]